MADKPFLTDIKTLRERARQHIEQGAITPGYKADRDTVLNDSMKRWRRRSCARSVTNDITSWLRASMLRQWPRSFSNTPPKSRDTPIKSLSVSFSSAALLTFHPRG